MKIFLSWSGKESHALSLRLTGWLKLVLSNVETFVSSEDIASGAKWNNSIDTNLQESDFGIICVTKSNIASPWLLFEAGALSTAKAKQRVSPFLLGIGPEDIKSTPLAYFQCTFSNRESVLKLVKTLHKENGISSSFNEDESTVTDRFDRLWPELDSELTEYVHNKQSFLFSFSSITEGLNSIFGRIQSVSTLDIYALNTQTIVNQLESYKTLDIGSVRVISPSEGVTKFLYTQPSQQLSNDTDQAIKQIALGTSTAKDIWNTRIGHSITKIDYKVIDIFPTMYFCIVDNEIGILGYYQFNKIDSRHGLKLTDTYTFDRRNAESIVRYHIDWFNKAWDVAI